MNKKNSSNDLLALTVAFSGKEGDVVDGNEPVDPVVAPHPLHDHLVVVGLPDLGLGVLPAGPLPVLQSPDGGHHNVARSVENESLRKNIFFFKAGQK